MFAYVIITCDLIVLVCTCIQICFYYAWFCWPFLDDLATQESKVFCAVFYNMYTLWCFVISCQLLILFLSNKISFIFVGNKFMQRQFSKLCSAQFLLIKLTIFWNWKVWLISTLSFAVDPPSDLNFKIIDENTVHMSWARPTDPIVGYRITVDPTTGKFCY